MATRYSTTRVLTNASDYYAPLRKKRGDKRIRQYETPKLHQPSTAEMRAIASTTHIWKSTDRLSNLAHKHYGDVRYWWVIAWYNGYPTEAHLFAGASLFIPISLDSALNALRV
jgi:nucleoid-associated protein YgaU